MIKFKNKLGLSWAKLIQCWLARPLTFTCIPVRSSSLEVVFLWGCLHVRLSSCEVVFLWGCHPVRLSSCEVVFLWGCHPVRLSSCEFVFLWGCLPVRLSSCEVVFLWCCLPVRFSSFEIDFMFGHLHVRWFSVSFFFYEVAFMWGFLPVRLSSYESAIRVFCWKINFHRWLASGCRVGGWLVGWRVAGSTENKANLSHGFFWAGARAELGNMICLHKIRIHIVMIMMFHW